MEIKNIIILSSLDLSAFVDFKQWNHLNINLCKSNEELLALINNIEPLHYLVTYNTSTIITRACIDKFRSAYNIHAASPEFPGRDPHHWAVYRKAKQYGATLHVLEEKVDSGAIIKTSLFNTTDNNSPQELLDLANKEAILLLEWILNNFEHSIQMTNSELKWGEIKTKRQDLLDICNLTDIENDEEINIRIKAFYSTKVNNFYIQKGKYKFYLKLE